MSDGQPCEAADYHVYVVADIQALKNSVHM